MATDPAFAATVNHGVGLPGSAETNLSVPTQSVTAFTAGASGSKVEEIVVEAETTTLTPTTVAGLVYIFIYDGANYHLFDTIPVTAVTASTTVQPFRINKTYTNLVLKSTESIKVSQSIAGNASLLKVHCLGGDF